MFQSCRNKTGRLQIRSAVASFQKIAQNPEGNSPFSLFTIQDARFALYIVFIRALTCCSAVTTQPNAAMDSTNSLVSELAQQGIYTSPPDEKSRYIITPRDGSDNSTIQDIEYDLKKITEAKKIYSFTDQSRGKIMWWILRATPYQLKEIRQQKIIKFAGRSGKAAQSYAVNHSFERTPPSLDDDDDDDREPGYFTLTTKDDTQVLKAQSNTTKELRQLSILKDAIDQNQWPDYVYQQAVGKGIYILYIELVSVFPYPSQSLPTHI